MSDHNTLNLFTPMPISQKRKQDKRDTSHTFLVPLQDTHSSSVGPAVVDKVSADYHRTLPPTHKIWPPTPPLDPFFDNFRLGGDEDSCNNLGDLGSQLDSSTDLTSEHGKNFTYKVSFSCLFFSLALLNQYTRMMNFVNGNPT